MMDGDNDRASGRRFSMDDEPEPEGFAEWSAVESAKAAMRRGITERSAREAFGIPDDVPIP